jgi:hypothetical protein
MIWGRNFRCSTGREMPHDVLYADQFSYCPAGSIGVQFSASSFAAGFH